MRLSATIAKIFQFGSNRLFGADLSQGSGDLAGAIEATRSDRALELSNQGGRRATRAKLTEAQRCEFGELVVGAGKRHHQRVGRRAAA